MSPFSTTDVHGSHTPSARPRVDDRGILALGTLALALVAVFGQLDAVAKKYAGFLPLSPFELLLALLVGLSALLIALPAGRRPAMIDPLGGKLIALLICWIGVSFVFAEHHDLAFAYAIRAVAVMLLPFLIGMFLRDPTQLQPVLWGIMGAGIVTALIIIYETKTGARLFSTSAAAVEADFEGKIRSAGGSDLNPTSVAQMLMVAVLLAAGLLASGYKRFRLPMIALILLGTAAIVMTSARSAVIGLGIGGIIILFRFYRSRWFPLILLGGIALAATSLLFLPATTLARFQAVANFAEDRSLYRRITYLRIGWDLLQQSPIWGVGPGNFPSHYVEAEYRFLPGRTLNPRELHNTYLDAAVEYGLVGFALFMSVLGTAFFAAARAARRAVDPLLARMAHAIMAALVALYAASFFMPHKDFRYLWLMIGLAMACGAMQRFEARCAGEGP
ncbi:O-antigen ligase family protein [Novosphingopyxis sp. YJ-S2-01]|uniref:O-antigen ligase family protein n=1 Tax=Novosphingopyxis sp. YJ-S2-01 TaxID=2794021 RepID=UPI0018DD433B|nr:O-antigen ligase family protein [Novosphingopyxis sp. YJ-S2-01]MBH9536252.1 O-antigen ligase family protein [Novosphingopyxis sp. YJ-S2-01]